ncbi:MAG: hypothetical protein WC608_02095 [Parcubacteria group bacterium]
MIPIIKFCFSPIYNSFFERFVKFPIHGKEFPAVKEVIKKMNRLEKEWRKIEKKILKGLVKYTNLNWQKKEIDCYFVGKCIPFSDPLTICPRENNKETVNLLIHELIHQLIFQNRNNKKVQNIWKYLEKKYRKESKLTISHIIVHAIHSRIYAEYFSEQEKINNIRRDNQDINYARSWEIVNDLGYQKILDQLRSGVSLTKF